MSRQNIENGRYWNTGWQLVDGCTPCSPGCDHCWSAAMAHRFGRRENNPLFVTDPNGHFDGTVRTHPDRLSIPMRTRKPTVFAVWNDLFHEAVSAQFINDAWNTMFNDPRNTFLVLTKRPAIMEKWIRMAAIVRAWPLDEMCPDNIYHGLTICNQAEADAKRIFLNVPGNLFLSLEPLLSSIDITGYLRCPLCGYTRQDQLIHGDHYLCPGKIPEVRAVILGFETGPGARPGHPDWVRSVRDQCAAAGVPFFFKGWGEWSAPSQAPADVIIPMVDAGAGFDPDSNIPRRFGRKAAGRLLDGRTHDELPWVKVLKEAIK